MKRESTETRQAQIKEAVLDIIYTDGLKNLSTRNLAKRIGMSEATIFRHFASKQEIVLTIIQDVKYDFIGALREIANSKSAPEDKLKLFLCKTVKYVTENKGITMLMFSEASHNNDSELKNILNQIFNSQKDLVCKIFAEGIADEIWDKNIPAENLAMLYMGIPVSLNIELILNNGIFHMDDFCDKMMNLLMKVLHI